MAVTKLLALKARVDNRIKYILNAEKTEHRKLISTYNCEALTAHIDFAATQAFAMETPLNVNPKEHSILAYHLIQSFSPNDNVTPEEAHEIAKELANQLLGGRFEYVIATHTDKAHIHSHIIFNATSFLNYQKFRTQPYRTAQKIRAISDRLCAEHGLSIVQNPQKLRCSYAEWQARRSGTCWRSELRKRLRFVAARVDSYDEFLAQCASLNVAVDDRGKHIKFRLRDLPQQRWARGNKLADNDSFTLEGIQAAVSENAAFRETLAAALAEWVPRSQNWAALAENLAAHCGIKIQSGKSNLRFSLPDGTVKTSAELGAAFSRDALEAAIRQGKFCPEPMTRNLRNEWDAGQQSITSGVGYVPIALPLEAVKKITRDGLLVALPGEGAPQVAFFDSNHVDYDSRTRCYTVWIAPPYRYDCAPERPDPEALNSGASFRGAELIRRMERAWGGGEEWINAPPEWVLCAGQNGLLLSLPEAGVKRLRVPPEDFKLTTDGCKIRVFPHWSYAKNFYGAELLAAAKAPQKVPVLDVLWAKYRSYERRNQRAEVAALSQTLWTMERESVSNPGDFPAREKALNAELDANKTHEKAVQAECDELHRALTSLAVLEKYTPIHYRWNHAAGGERLELEAQHAVQLRLYERAAAQVQRAGLSPTSDPEKVSAYLADRKKELARLQTEGRELERRLTDLRDAERVVKAVLEPPTLSGAANKLQQKNHHYTL